MSAPFVSTGRLPPDPTVAALVADAHLRFRPVTDGTVSTVYPTLARASADLFGLCVGGVSGNLYPAGDADRLFPLMSVAKPFVFALTCDAVGPAAVRERVGVNATGRPFNSASAVEADPAGRTNPMVNAGAIATAALVPGGWDAVRAGLSRFAGRELELDAEVFDCASETNHQNRGLAHLLAVRGRLADPLAAVDLYTRQSSLSVTAVDLAVMGATLAAGGVNPRTGDRVVSAAAGRHALAVMATAGLYETSGDWLYEVGVPGKSGIGGGIVTVAPGKGALGSFSPPLDAAGNSVRGARAAAYLAGRLGLDLFASESRG